MSKRLISFIGLMAIIGALAIPVPANALLTVTITNSIQGIWPFPTNPITAHTGDTVSITESFGSPLYGIYVFDFTFDHTTNVTVISTSGFTPATNYFGSPAPYKQVNGGSDDYTTYSFSGSTAHLIFWSNTPGTLVFTINSITPLAGETPDPPSPTPAPTSPPTSATPDPTSPGTGPTATMGTIVPFGVSGPNIYTRTPLPIIYPTAATCGLYNQCNLYSPPSAIPAGSGGLFTFSIGDEVNIANNVIGVYRLANSQGAVNILMILFSVFGGIGLLFMVIKKAGK